MDKNKLPDGWKLEKLSSYVDTLETGSRPRGGVSQYTSGVPSISAEQILPNGNFYWDKIKFVPESFYNSAERGHIQRGDILIVKDGATTGKVAYVGNDFPYSEAIVNEHTFILTVTKKIMTEWVYLYLRSHYLADFRKRAREKGIIGGLTQNFPEEIEIPLPPLPEQRRIVARIEQLTSRLDKARELQKQAVEETESLFPSVISKHLTSDGWEFKRLGEVKGRSGLFTDGDWIVSKNMDSNGSVRLLQLADIGIGTFLNKSAKFISEEKFNELGCTEVKPGDVLVSRMADPVARACVVPQLRQKMIAAVDISIVRVDPTITKAKFLATLCNSSIVRERANALARGSTRKRISRKDLEKIEVPVPPIPEQEQIIAKIEESQAKAEQLKQLQAETEAELENFMPALLAKAFRGELVEMADSGFLIVEVAEHYRTDVSLSCLVLQHFKKRGKTIREFHLQKYAYIAQQHLKLPIVSEFQPMAAGPWSSAFKNYACAYARQQQWFSLKGRNVEPGKALKAGTTEAEKILGRQRGKVLQLLDDLKRFGDSGLERWATILMVVSQLKAARKAVTRWNIQEAIDNWSGKRNKEWFTKISVSKAIDGMNQKGWIKLIGE